MTRTTPPYILTFHAVERYRSRVGPNYPGRGPTLDYAQAAQELSDALRIPLFQRDLRGGGALLGCLNGRGKPFLARLHADGRTVETCGAAWFWHGTRTAWRVVGWDVETGCARRPGGDPGPAVRIFRLHPAAMGMATGEAATASAVRGAIGVRPPSSLTHQEAAYGYDAETGPCL